MNPAPSGEGSASAPRETVASVEEGTRLCPKFDRAGLIPAIVSDAETGNVLMLGYMNATALRRTLETSEAHFWSRSRQCLWRKGATSGFVQRVVELRVDDDQDALWLRVRVEGGASCHVGFVSCFYRAAALGPDGAAAPLRFVETEKSFDPAEVYGDAPNPTRL